MLRAERSVCEGARRSPPFFKRFTVRGARIRFFDSDSEIVWNELSLERGISLVPVEDIGTEHLVSEVAELRSVYVAEPPYVFLHVSVVESPVDDIVVWAIRRNCQWALVHAVGTDPIADTIAEITLALGVRSVIFRWEARRLSLVKHYLLRSIGRRSAIPLDVMRLLRCKQDDSHSPKVLMQLIP